MGSEPVKAGEFRLEIVVIPVSDVDRAKSFYQSLGWRLDADLAKDENYRIVQLTPPGSACSIIFGTGLTAAPAGRVGTAPSSIAEPCSLTSNVPAGIFLSSLISHNS